MTLTSMLRVSLAAVLACLLGGTLAAQTRLVFTDAYLTEAHLVTTPTSLSATGFATATAEPGEPAHDGTPARNSLWARFTAKDSGLFRLARPLDVTTRLRIAIYTNETLSGLGRVTSVTMSGDTNELRWEAIAGTTYSIALDATNRTPTIPAISLSKFFVRATPDRPLKLGEVVALEAVSTDPTAELGELTFSRRSAVAGAPGTFGTRTNFAALSAAPWRVSLTNTAGGLVEVRAQTATLQSLTSLLYLRPAADDLADAAGLPGAFSAIVEQRSLGAGSVEPGEFLPRANEWFGTPATIWWKWTPAFSVNFVIRSSPHGLWAAYEGDPWTNAPLGSGFNALQFRAEAGRTYYLQMVVAGTAKFAVNTVEFRQEVLALTLPPGSLRDDSINPFNGKEPGYLIPANILEVGVTNLLPAESFTGFRLNAAEPARFTPEGLPGFDLSLPSDGALFSLTATNQNGVRVTAPRVFLAVRPTNDVVTSASEWPPEGLAGINGLLATASPDDPAVLGGPTARSRWWMFSSPSEATVELSVGATGPTPLPATLAVFRGMPETASQPVVLYRDSLRFSQRQQFEAVAGERYYVSADIPGLFSLGMPVIHPFQWRNLPRRLGVGLNEWPELGPASEAGVIVNRIEFDGRSANYQGSPPLTFHLEAFSAGDKTLRVTYTLANGANQVMEHPVAVSARGDDFVFAVDNRLVAGTDSRTLQGTGELTYSSLQEGEPDPFGGSAGSVWHGWSSSLPGEYILNRTQGSNVQIAVFEGDQLANLKLIGVLDSAGLPLRFAAAAVDKSYRIRVSSATASRDSYAFTLEWVPEVPVLSLVKLTPVNDSETSAELTFTSVPNQPYSAWSAELPAGPWTLEWQGTPGANTTDVTLPVRTSPAFFRVTSP